MGKSECFLAAACIDGSCPMARADEYGERDMDVVKHCRDCPWHDGECKDCYFYGTEYCDGPENRDGGKKKKQMTVKELETAMKEHGAVIRTIPVRQRSIFEVEWKDRYPHGTITYLEGYDREMLVVESVPEHAGKFLIESIVVTGSVGATDDAWFRGKYFDTLEDVVDALRENDAGPKGKD